MAQEAPQIGSGAYFIAHRLPIRDEQSFIHLEEVLQDEINQCHFISFIKDHDAFQFVLDVVLNPDESIQNEFFFEKFRNSWCMRTISTALGIPNLDDRAWEPFGRLIRTKLNLPVQQ